MMSQRKSHWKDILDLFPSCPTTLPQWKGHDICSPTVLRSNDPIPFPARAFDNDEDTSEPEEDHMLLIQELVLKDGFIVAYEFT